MAASGQDGLQLQVCQWWVKWDHNWGNWSLKTLTVEEGFKVGSKYLSCGAHQGMGWAQEAPKVNWALFSQVGQLGVGSIGCTVAGLAKSSVGSQTWGIIVAMLPASSPGSVLGYPAGIIKPVRAVLTVLVGVVGLWGPSKAHLIAGI